MDVVLRTPHGEGEISLVADLATVTLGDVVERVVGHPAPPVVYVDGRAASANTFVSDAGVVIGSLIDTDDAAIQAANAAPVEIWQLAGHGCGMTAPLLAGDYRIGPGRRVHATELSMAPVDDAVMELRVTDDGRVMVRDRGGVELIGGPPTSADRFVDWTDERLAVDGRIFTLVRPIDPGSTAAEARVDEPVVRRPSAAGTITFHRTADSDVSTVHSDDSPNPTDALVLARTQSAKLWQRRRTGPGDFKIPLGLHITDSGGRQAGDQANGHGQAPANDAGERRRLQVVEAELDVGRGLAFVGGTDFTRSAAAGLLVLATTMYGPADLEVVVVTTPDSADNWEWAKWLPHNRVDGRPSVLVNDQQLRGWSRRRRSRWNSSAASARRTLMVVDDDNAWNERSSALREIVADESAPISFAVLTNHLHDVPSLCETVMSERSHGTAHVELRQTRRRYDDVHAFVVSTELAAEVARRLAPLDDADMAPVSQVETSDLLSINDLHGVGSDPRPTIAHRWNVAAPDLATLTGNLHLRLGSSSGQSPTDVVSVDIVAEGPHLLVTESDGRSVTADRDRDGDGDGDGDGAAIIEAALIGACVDRPPDEVEIVLLSGGATSSTLARLPHVSADLGHLDRHGLRRALRSLEAEHQRRRALLEHAGVEDIAALHDRVGPHTLRRLLVVVDRLDAATGLGLDDLRPIIAIGPEIGIHVIVHASVAHAGDVAPAAFGATVVTRRPRSEHSNGGSHHPPSTPLPRATLRIGRGRPVNFDPPNLAPDQTDDAGAIGTPGVDGLSIQPFVVARDLTPMERRLIGTEVGSVSPAPVAAHNAAVLAVLDALESEAPLRPRSGSAPIASELPEHVDLIELLREHPGDGVPFALADAPSQQGHEPIWWSPGDNCSVVAYGVARSRVSALVPALAVGAATRLGPADVQFHVVCPDAATLEPLAQLPHTASVTSARARPLIESLIDELHAEVDRRLRLVGSDTSAARVAARETPIVVLIDDVGGCRRLFDGDDRDLWSEFEHLLVLGQPVGVCAVLIARRTDEISARLAATIGTHLVAQLATNDDDHRFVRAADEAAPGVPGRAWRASDGVDLQFAVLSADLRSVITEHIIAPPDRERP